MAEQDEQTNHGLDLEGARSREWPGAEPGAAFEGALIRLSGQAQEQFAELLVNPPEMAPALERAFRCHAELVRPDDDSKVRAGLEAVDEYEREHGAFTREELDEARRRARAQLRGAGESDA